ncbi:hypothetical protein RFI_14230 [Reticulomyxa filosa]|uniref:Kelch motif family protein n=1 Tax=Reticulomyxa filosa TaxID=46433 RepID=X6NAC3_RETFI|nr:hypothetical protein RFI_14230 [Reticulomyxa filosa]|eukprot:ETO22956.1 hypothetical protein RFI_14230 [Reticulomyxa filosa]
MDIIDSIKMDLSVATLKGDKSQTKTVACDYLAPLPGAVSHMQSVSHKNEIIICGMPVCYSYHVLKNQYKRICSYPRDTILSGYCVIKWIKSADNISLLAFGKKLKNPLVMNYISVWDEGEEHNKKIRQAIHFNEWVPLIYKSNPIYTKKHDGEVRGVIGGSKNNLLFLVCSPNRIAVLNLDTLEFDKRGVLPVGNADISDYCLVTKHDFGSKEITHIFEMVFFGKNIGLLIEYNEIQNNFQFRELWICSTIRALHFYSYVHVNGAILFFGGFDGTDCSKSVHKYSIQKNQWTKFEHTLPCGSSICDVALTEDKAYVHVIGTASVRWGSHVEHIRIKVDDWMKEDTEMERQWKVEEEEKRKLEEIQTEIKQMGNKIDIRALTVDLISC